MKILLYTHEIAINMAGGAEKVLASMANALIKKGYEVTVACSSEKEGALFYPLDEKVKFVNLNFIDFAEKDMVSTKRNFFEEFLYKNLLDKEAFLESKKFSDKFVAFLEQEKPDLIISYYIHTYRHISYCKDLNIPTIIMMHSHPDRFFKFYGTKYFPINRLILNKIDICQVLLPSHVKSIKQYFYGDVEVIANAISALSPDIISDKEKTDKTILTISRFDKHKRQDILIEAFGLIAHKHPDWQLHLYGQFDSEKTKEYIFELIKKYNIDERIKYKGATLEPLNVMQEADIFVLPSDFEGFSIATAEAMSVGLPSIAFKDCEGLSELIINNKTGFLTEKTPQDLAKHIEILIENPDLRLEFSKNAKERIKEFAPEIVWDKWENAIKKAVLIHNKKSIRKFFILFFLYINIFFTGILKQLKR